MAGHRFTEAIGWQRLSNFGKRIGWQDEIRGQRAEG